MPALQDQPQGQLKLKKLKQNIEKDTIMTVTLEQIRKKRKTVIAQDQVKTLYTAGL